MVLTRFLHLQIWDVYNEYIQYDNKVDTNWGITSGSVKLDKILMSEQLNYGEINASKLELQVFGLDVDLSNRKIKLEAIDAVVEDDYLVDDSQNYIVTDALDFITVGTLDPEHIFPLFCGYIESADKDYMSTDRNIEAYDWFYYHRDDNIADWWNDWWMENSPYSPTTVTVVNVAQFLDDLFTELGLTSSKIFLELPGALLEITNPFVYVSTTDSSTSVEYFVTELKLGDILSMLGKMCSWTPIIDGGFTNVDFIWLDNGNTYNLEGNMEKEDCRWEDFQTDAVTGVAIYDSSSELAQTYGTTTNMYQVVGNIFILNMSAQQLSNRAQWIYNQVKDIQYTPAQIKCIISDLYHKLGDKIVTDKGTSYILQQSLSGALLVEEDINCPSKNGRTLDTTVEDINDAIIEGAKSAIFEKDIDHMTVEYSNKIAGLTTRVNQNTQAITAEAQRAQSQEEIAGVVTSYEVIIYPDIDPQTGKVLYPGKLLLHTNITLERTLVNGVRFGVWVKDMPAQYATYEKAIAFDIQEAPGVPPFEEIQDIYYSEATPLTNQYSSGVILHLMYMANQQITVGTSTVTRTGFWIGADDSYAKISVTADEIRQEVSSGYVDINSYNSEVQNLQNQIDGHIDYWDGGYVPTLQNAPANTWTTESEKNRHLGDLFRYKYQQSGEDVVDYYRFDKDTTVTPNVFSWVKLGKDDIDEAIRKADEANAKAEAAQEQLDNFLAQGGEFSTWKQTVNRIDGEVDGVIAREPIPIQFKVPFQTLSYGKVFTVTEAFTPVDGKIYTTAITNGGWQVDTAAALDGAKYIKVNDNTLILQTNTFPIFYHGNTVLTGQIAQGDTLSVKYYDNYTFAPSGSKKCFVVQTSDHVYERAHSELSIEKGRMVLRAESGNKMVIQRLDATGEASEFFVSADNISMSAEEAMSFLSGGTLTLAGENGVVIDSPNFKVRRDGSVEVTGAITASSLTLIEGGNVEGFADIALSGSYDDLEDTPDLDIIDEDGNISGGTYAQGSTGIRISKAGLLQASNAVIYGNIYASNGIFNGVVYASSGSFTGTVYATNGRFTGEIQSTSGKIGNFNITTNGFSKASSTSGFTLSDNMLYFSSGENEANTLSVGPLGLSTKGYVNCTSITKRGDTWGNSNTSDLDTALKNTLYASYGKGSTTITNAWCFGIVTSNSTQLSLLIPISCIRTDTTISVSDTRISLRTGAGGYVVSADAGIGSASGVVLQNQHMLYVAFTRPNKWTNSNTGNAIPNNSVVIGQISFDIEFS